MLRNEQMNEQGAAKKKPWPENCPWPEPTAYGYDYDEGTVGGIYDVEAWRDDLSEHVNLLRIAPMDPHEDPVI